MPRVSQRTARRPRRHLNRGSQVLSFLLIALLLGSALVNAPLIIRTVRDINLAAWHQTGPFAYQGYGGILGRLLAVSLDLLLAAIGLWAIGALLRWATVRGRGEFRYRP